MADNNQKDLVNTPKYSSEKKSSHPLKNIPFFGIPRHIALLPELTDRLFRLLSILCSAFGEDGHIEFKIKTLCKLMGGKSDKSTRRIIEEAEQLGLISTYQTGRSLVFNLTEKFYKNPISEASNSRIHYFEKLKNPLWQKKRLKIFERDEWKCRHCGKDDSLLVVHHIKYKYGLDPWEYEDCELITLCENCHMDTHRGKND